MKWKWEVMVEKLLLFPWEYNTPTPIPWEWKMGKA